MILIVYSDVLCAVLHLFAVIWFICNRHDRQRKNTTQRRDHQGKGDKNKD